MYKKPFPMVAVSADWIAMSWNRNTINGFVVQWFVWLIVHGLVGISSEKIMHSVVLLGVLCVAYWNSSKRIKMSHKQRWFLIGLAIAMIAQRAIEYFVFNV